MKQYGYFNNKTYVITDRNIYISDGEKFWQATGLPVHEAVDEYYWGHNIGYTDIVFTKNGIKSICRFFVPNKENREILKVTVQNVGDEDKKIKVIPFSDTNIDGVYTPQGYNTSSAKFYNR